MLVSNGADPPMRNPDLVSIGDGACVNFAHVIAHTNTLGTFSLNTVIIRERATLCSESRIMGGSVIGPDAFARPHLGDGWRRRGSESHLARGGRRDTSWKILV